MRCSCSIRSSAPAWNRSLREFGVVLDDDIVIDEASHFWTDISAPAVTDYNRHEVTRDLPLTFFPGARSLSPTPRAVPGTSVRPVINSSKKSYGGTNRERAEFNPDKDKAGTADADGGRQPAPGVRRAPPKP